MSASTPRIHNATSAEGSGNSGMRPAIHASKSPRNPRGTICSSNIAPELITPPSTIPASARATPSRPVARLASIHTSTRESAAPNTAPPNSPPSACVEMPVVAAIASTHATPKDAPLETPSVYGDASGFRSSACNARPASPSNSPTTAAPATAFARNGSVSAVGIATPKCIAPAPSK